MTAQVEDNTGKRRKGCIQEGQSSSKWEGEIKQRNNRGKLSKAKYKETTSTSMTNETRQILVDSQDFGDHKQLLRVSREKTHI